MHCNIASCNAMLLQEEVSYSVIPYSRFYCVPKPIAFASQTIALAEHCYDHLDKEATTIIQ